MNQSDHQKLTTRAQPHHAEAERAILGAILRDNAQMEELSLLLKPDDMYVGIHRRIFEAIFRLYEQGYPIDVINLTDILDMDELDRAGGIPFLTDLFDATPPGTDPTYYARIVKDRSLRRRLIHIATNTAAETYDGEHDVESIINETERELINLTETGSTRPYHSILDLATQAIKTIETRWNQELVGLDIGFKDLNDKTGGLHPNELTIVAARPGMGKTAFALNMAMNAGLLGKEAVLFFSLEMGAEQLVQRLLASECGIDQQKLRKGVFSREEWPAIVEAAGNLGRAPLYIDDTPALTVATIFSKARRLIGDLRRKEQKLGLIIVDYLQLMHSGRRSDRRDLEISEISRGLKLLSKDLEIPVIALSQLNRGLESRPNKRPMLSDLRESGAIEQDADNIIFIYRDEIYNEGSEDQNIAEIIIGKQRNGPLGTVKLRFTAEYTRFDNLDMYHHVPGAMAPMHDAELP